MQLLSMFLQRKYLNKKDKFNICVGNRIVVTVWTQYPLEMNVAAMRDRYIVWIKFHWKSCCVLSFLLQISLLCNIDIFFCLAVQKIFGIR